MYEKIGDKVYEKKEVGNPRMQELRLLRLLKRGEIDRLKAVTATRVAELQKIVTEIEELKALGMADED